MATPIKEFGYGDVEVYSEETFGAGSYGKVCKAKCGQLPCAAKLLHDTMFGTNDPGIRKFVEQFEQECRFLRMIKHPNIVQFLGTVRDPQSQRLALLMELMDENLTRFLEQSTGLLPYHTQLNISYDVALALSYLHSNDIIHRDLSSNNVLLIGEGSRAKVTDFGMSKLEDMNPRMTPLTMCPGTQAYMPPEALITPPRYSNKLDCFSHGVLTIQIVTRQFPNPGDAHVEDSQKGSFQQVPEKDRRKKDLDLVDTSHPLLPLALHCLELRATERPSADELCERLATLKSEQVYTCSVEQSRGQIQTLQEELEEARISHQRELAENTASLQEELKETRATYQQLLEIARANHDTELHECHVTFLQQNRKKDSELASYQQEIQDRCDELERVRVNHETELGEYARNIQEKNDELERASAMISGQQENYELLIEQLRNENDKFRQKRRQPKERSTLAKAKILPAASENAEASGKELQVCISIQTPFFQRYESLAHQVSVMVFFAWPLATYLAIMFWPSQLLFLCLGKAVYMKYNNSIMLE